MLAFFPSISQSVNSALKKVAESTPTMSKSIQDALLCADSFAKSQKTKNSSNKNKERTSVAGTIVKLLNRMDLSTNESLGNQMNMMIMKQLEEMNRGMARRACKEMCDRKK